VHNYFTELTRAAIYRFHRRWRLILRRRAAARKGVVTSARLPWHFTVARPPTMTGHAKASHYDEVLRLGTWHPSGRRPTPAMLSGPVMRQVGTAARAEQCPKLIPGARFFTEDRYPHSIGRESRRRRESERKVTGCEIRCNC
jgi:hypothetical protein